MQKHDAMSHDHNLLKVEMSLSPTTYLSVSSTSITCAPPSKNVGWKCSSMPLKQHRCWHHLPLPSPSALPRHLTLSIENAFPSLLTPSSAMSLDVEHRGCLPWSAIALAPSTLPHHPMLSIKDAPGLPMQCPCTLCLATSCNTLQ